MAKSRKNKREDAPEGACAAQYKGPPTILFEREVFTGRLAGWRVVHHGNRVELREPPSYKQSVDRIGEAEEARHKTQQHIDDAIASLRAFRERLGTTIFVDQVIAKCVRGVTKALENDADGGAARDLSARLVRDAGAALAKSVQEQRPVSAESLAELMIEKCAKAPTEIIPFGSRLAGARVELVAAIDASGQRGAPPVDLRGRRVKRQNNAPKLLLELLKKMGFAVKSDDVLKSARRRLKKG